MGKRRFCYTVEYKMYDSADVKTCDVIAGSKEEAWEQATFCVIPYVEKSHPYSSWVCGVTYNNGNHKSFNTLEGKPY